VTAHYDGIIVHSLHPSNIIRRRGSETRCGRGGYEKGDPGLLRKTGAYRPNGVRGDWGLGARPPGTRLLNAAAPIQFLPPHLVFECCGPAPQGCRKAFLAFRLATLPRAGTPWEGKRGVEVWLCAPLLFKCAPQRTVAARRKSGSLLKTAAERAGDRD
jgi:hypothetical protein